MVDPRRTGTIGTNRKGVNGAQTIRTGAATCSRRPGGTRWPESLRSSGSGRQSPEDDALFSVTVRARREHRRAQERRGVLRRTHGGGVLPTTARRRRGTPSARRLKVAAEPKLPLAEEAVALMGAWDMVFLDYLDDELLRRAPDHRDRDRGDRADQQLPRDGAGLRRRGGKSTTSSGVGGSLRRLTRSFVGPFAVQTLHGPLRRPALPQRQGPHRRRDDGPTPTQLEAEVKRTIQSPRPASRRCSSTGSEDAGARAERDRLGVGGLERHRARPLDRGRRGAQGRAPGPCGCSNRKSSAPRAGRSAASCRRQRAHGRGDLLRLAAVGGLGQDPRYRGPEPVGGRRGRGRASTAPAAIRVERDARTAGALDGGGVRPLVGGLNSGTTTCGTLWGERAERGPVPTVADDRGSVRQRRVPCVTHSSTWTLCRQAPQLRGITAVPDSSAARAPAAAGARRSPRGRGPGVREVLARGLTEPRRRVDEWGVVVARPPVGQRRRARRAGRKRWVAAAGDGEVLERPGASSGTACRGSGRRRVGRQAELGARCVHRGHGQVDRERLERGEPECDPDDGIHVELGDAAWKRTPSPARRMASGR